ncbi:MAG: site-specific integrase, partial [Candidatus Nanopelagicaceae bacterium]
MSQELLDGYREHLVLERNLSENSIRAYIADLDSLLVHINALGITEFKALTLDHLRSWLANQQSKGAARSTIIRRVASIKAFTYWAADNGWLDSDIGLQLRAPKPQRSLPKTIKAKEIEVALSSLESIFADTGDDLRLRDLAMVELLYS